MKRLAIFDFDGTLINTFEPIKGKVAWEKYYNKLYPHVGWWGRKESLDTKVFDIKPFPKVLAQLELNKTIVDTKVIILTSRREKLRLYVEKILNNNNIIVDDIILKRGNETKGDVILKIVDYNHDLEEIVVFDDFMNRDAEKISEYTKINNLLPLNIKYELFYVNSDNISPLIGDGVISFDTTNKLLNTIV